MNNSLFRVVVIVGVIIFVDQLTKTLIVQHFQQGEHLPILPFFFDLTHMRNPGAAFSFLAEAPEWFRQPFFLIAPGIAIVALLFFIVSARDEGLLLLASAASILGGAIGNVIDRLLYGEVIDFLFFYMYSREWSWPAFNVADSCITLGVVGLLWVSWRKPAAAPRAQVST